MKDGERSIRVILPADMHDQVKERCLDHGDISKVVRFLLLEWIEGRIPQARQMASRLGGGEYGIGSKSQPPLS